LKGEVLELPETLKIVLRRSGHAHLERAPPHHAREAEPTAREFSKQQKPVTTGAHKRIATEAPSRPGLATHSE
jgi:hypothetical protein